MAEGWAMKGLALIYRPYQAEPERVPLDSTPTLAFMQETVAGYIELVATFDTVEVDGGWLECRAFCNEEGKPEGLPINNAATMAWDQAMRRCADEQGRPFWPNGLLDGRGAPIDVLVGPVLVITGDAELMAAL